MHKNKIPSLLKFNTLDKRLCAGMHNGRRPSTNISESYNAKMKSTIVVDCCTNYDSLCVSLVELVTTQSIDLYKGYSNLTGPKRLKKGLTDEY